MKKILLMAALALVICNHHGYGLDQEKFEVQITPTNPTGVRGSAGPAGAPDEAEYAPEMEPHWCDRGHYGCILSGEFEIRFAERVLVFRAGNGVHIPSGAEHRHMARALSPVVRALFVEDPPAGR